jgi:hypothetical protein
MPSLKSVKQNCHRNLLSVGRLITALLLILPLGFSLHAREIHVSKSAGDVQDGTLDKPFLSISQAAEIAEAGDSIWVHEGIYRERVDPPRGGLSPNQAISYLAVAGDDVIIKGSETLGNWRRWEGSVWKAALSRQFFGDFNPYEEIIYGDWFVDKGRDHHLGEVYLNGSSLFEVDKLDRVLQPPAFERSYLSGPNKLTWYCETDEDSVYLYANFGDKNPNNELVEINVRSSCFYPSKPGINYITVRGFTMMHAATQWAAPTAEQIALIGTHWSKGWVIEDNRISYSKCSGVSLGKDRASGHNTWSENPEINGAVHYNKLILKILQEPFNWSKENIGSHLVRNNEISHCEQTGICGSMGGAFSVIEGNYIHDIWEKRQFEGAELAGIKLHGPIDALIENNLIVNCPKGIWLDWMTQGTRVTRNTIYGSYTEDFFAEVNHGPYVVDHNLFLSNCVSILDGSGGGAYLHNLVNSKIIIVQQRRETPYQEPHGTQVWGHAITQNGDNRYFGNVFFAVPENVTDTMMNPWWKKRGTYGLELYQAFFPMYVSGNMYFGGALPFPDEKGHVYDPDQIPGLKIIEIDDQVWIEFDASKDWKNSNSPIISSEDLGRAKVPDMPFETPDGSQWIFDQDFFGTIRGEKNNTAGPFVELEKGFNRIRIW